MRNFLQSSVKDSEACMGTATNEGSAWSRELIGLRLSKRRKADLMAIAETLPDGATPVQAIEHAILVANAEIADHGLADEWSESRNAPRISQIADDVTRLENKITLISATVESSSRKIAESIQSLRRLITDAAGLSGDEDDPLGRSTSEALPLRDWLASETRTHGLTIAQSAALRAKWRSKTRVGSGLVSLDFECEFAAVDGVRPRVSLTARPASLARMDAIDSRSPLARSDERSEIWLWCEPASGGAWRVRVHAVKDGGGLGELLSEHRC
ncbi:hypothetical protein PQQ99_01130 [Paraburkholderia sediminicola]|uniref:hypothetical protein n=1 Tax=Paraburkholderia sediminicola TaxID=458836 RepID=UPI0038BB747E